MHLAGEANTNCGSPQMVPCGARTAGPLWPRFDSCHLAGDNIL